MQLYTNNSQRGPFVSEKVLGPDGLLPTVAIYVDLLITRRDAGREVGKGKESSALKENASVTWSKDQGSQ